MPDEETPSAHSESAENAETGREPSSGCCSGAFEGWCSTAEKCARQEPAKCAAIAFLVGLIVTMLPVGQILAALVRLLFALIRPVLVVLGAMKVFEEIEKRR